MKVKIPNGYNVVDEYRTDITSPAYINPTKRELHINHTTFDLLKPDEQDFILCHELAHRYTVSELRADQMAFDRLMKITNSPKVAVNALYKALSGAMPEHDLRYARMLQIAAEYDLSHNHNENAKQVLQIANELVENAKKSIVMLDLQDEEKVVDMLIEQGYDIDEIYDAIERLEDSGEIGFEGEEYYASGKEERQKRREERRKKREERREKRQARRDAVADARAQRKIDKLNLKTQEQAAKIARKDERSAAKANLTNAKAQAKVLKAEGTKAKREGKGKMFESKGKAMEAGTYDPLGGLGEAIGGVVNKFAGDSEGGYEEKSASSSNLPLILGIGGGVLALIIIVVVIILVKRKK